ncbi:uncharacterized protein [Arachis hypogaea]|uniref:uncharacterized protein isoform X2 n=1 Tax=Arachis hypogaea TaxID=3818 RepID=UPI003B218428
MKPLCRLRRLSSIWMFILALIAMATHVPTSVGAADNVSYLACKNTLSCGSISQLTYPFWGQIDNTNNRSNYCGEPNLKITCEDNNNNNGVPKFIVDSVKYRILDWDIGKENLTVARDDYFSTSIDFCSGDFSNNTLDETILQYDDNSVVNITLLYKCSSETKPSDQFKFVQSCSSGSVYYAEQQDNEALPYYGSCSTVIFPVSKALASTFANSANNPITTTIQQALESGFGLKLLPQIDDQCRGCTNSGGNCGSNDGHFACFCNDGTRSNSCSSGSSSKWNWRLKTAIGATAAGVGIVVVFAVVICNRKRYFSLAQKRLIFGKTGESDDQNVEDFITTYGFLAPKRYSFSEVKKITNSFCDQLGKGGYGVVYKGKLSDGRLVAVKVINESKGSGEEFINEVASISRTSHVNIVSLLGFCNERNKRALIYEFMSNSSLDKFIYGNGSPTPTCNLDWNTLYQIAIGIARGLEYLHRGCGTRILHLDIKPQNILLDEDFCPKISDFGLSKICQKKESIVSILGTRGTIGYIAPEVFSRMYGGISHKSDVYSYGMLILEMVGGRKNYESGGSNSSEMYFPDWIYKDLEQGEAAYMLKLMNALKPPGWSNTTHMCHWTGVSCNNQSRRIEEIFLKEMSLTGTVPAGLNDSLSQLTYLYLSYNNLGGPVPSLANLSFLQVAYLDNNNFTIIPHGCFHGLTSLQSLLLNNNTNLPPWNFPTDLTAHSSQLDVLDLSSTNLMGSVPNISHSFPTLRYLSLSNNNLSSIPEDCFHNLTSLDVLSLANNTNLLPWTFPLDLTHSSFKLSYLDLQATNLMGFLPNLSHFFPDLITVSLSNNHLTFIPQGCFQALPYLGLLKLGNNTNLTPWTFPDLIQSTKIQELNLVATNVMGSLPEIFDSLTSLETLLLSNNSLTGVLPESFGRSKITTLHLNDQKGKGFSGTMDVVSNMIDLSEAWLQGNSFDGYILDMSRCTALQDLRLAHNRFTGVVPDSLINLSRKNLQTVILNNNFFQGPMPNILGDSDSTNVGDNTTNAFCRDDYDPCDERVTILLEIASAFGYPYLLARSWRGNNPCHNWSFVACTATMITTVNLTRQNLTGTISDAFGKLTHLENLYLSGNNLNGSIPENFTSLHQLKNLDVSNNNLSGKIPNFSRGVYLNTEGNPSFERRKPSGKRRNPPAWIKGAIAAAAGIGGLVFLVIIICNRKRCLSLLQRILWKKTGPFIDNEFEEFMKTYGSLMLRRYNYSEVKSMTNSFRDKLGKGGYGIVYKAYLSDGCLVAVKVLTESSGSGEEFLNEVASIGRTSHMNIVSLLGFCYEKYKRALIYEFMPNGSLDKFIYKQESPNAICNLDWNTLFQITIGIAGGLEYLHRGCATRILHLDIKPQNILLDEDFCPKIADFGLAKICKKKESIVSLQGTRGTPGYIAPEVFSRTFGKVSHKSDVYSYGMLILELVGGRKNYDTGGSLTSEMYFPDWIYKDLEEQNILGRGLSTTEEESDMIKKITLVSLWCIQTNPSDRPSINKAVEMLEGPLQSVPYPPKPVLYSPQMSISQFSRISYNSTYEEDSEIVEETISINKMSSKFAK